MFSRQNREISRKMLEVKNKFPLDADLIKLYEVGKEIFQRNNIDHKLIQEYLKIIKESMEKIKHYEMRKAHLVQAINIVNAAICSFGKNFETKKDELGLNEHTATSLNEIHLLLLESSDLLENSLLNGLHNEIRKERKSFFKNLLNFKH